MTEHNPMGASQSSHPLLDILQDRLDKATTADVFSALAERGAVENVHDLLLELRESSLKIAGEAVWALPELSRRCGLETVISWLDLGISLTQSSGAIGLRYFKDSPIILGVIDSQNHRKQVLSVTLELADSQSEFAPNCALEFFKKAPELLLEIPSSDLGKWSEIGLELAQWDYVLGNEFLRESPSIARAVSYEHVRTWMSFGMKLVSQNSLGKTDYLGTLEFFRRSPAILEEISEPELRKWVIDLGSVLADLSPQLASSFLADSPNQLRAIPSLDGRLRVLKHALLVADRDPDATLAFVRRSSEILHVAGDSQDAASVFDSWFQGGMEVLEYSVEAGRAYFDLESKSALASVEHAMRPESPYVRLSGHSNFLLRGSVEQMS